MRRLSRFTYSVGGVLLCYGVVLFLPGPCLTTMATTFDVPLARLGLIFTAFSVGLIPSVLSMGYLSELVGKRQVLLGALLALTVGWGLFAFVSSLGGSRSFPMAMGALVLVGIGGGGIEVLTNALVADDNQPTPGFALNLLHAFFAIGAVLGPLGAAAVMHAKLPWHLMFYAGAGLFAMMFLVLLPQRGPDRRDAAFDMAAALELLRSPLLLALLVVLGLYVGAEVGLVAWVSPLMEEVLGSARAAAGMAVSVFWVFMAVGRVAVSALAIRFRPAPLVVALAVGSVLACLVVAWAPTIVWCLVGSGASGLFMSGIFGLVMTDAAHRFPHRTGAAFGLVAAGVGVGSLIVPAAMGFVGGLGGLRAALLIPPGLMAAVAVIYVALWRR